MFVGEGVFEEDLEGDPVGEVFEEVPGCVPVGDKLTIDSFPFICQEFFVKNSFLVLSFQGNVGPVLGKLFTMLLF